MNELTSTYTVTLESPAALIETDGRRADAVRKRLEQLVTASTLTDFEQADLLAEAKTNGYWQQWKFPSWDDYIKSTGCDLSKREIAYRIQISLGAKLLEVNKTELAAAKMSKLKLIFSLDPTKEVADEATLEVESMGNIMKQLVSDAPHKSLKEIAEIVKRLKGETEDEEGELTWLNLPVRRDAKQVVIGAIELAQKLAGTTIDVLTKEEKDLSTAAALELIAGDYLADPNNQFDEGTAGDFEDFSDSVDDEFGEDEDA